MKILITGGFGFVGGRLATYLDSIGYSVVLGSRTKRQLPEWCKNAKVVVVNGSDLSSLKKAVDEIDCVIHAAGMNAEESMADPVGALLANGVFTASLVKASIQAGVKKFIYLSTAHVYNSVLKGDISESTCALNLHPYATSHKVGEDCVLFSHMTGAIEGIVFRLSNSFGTPAHSEVNTWSLLVNDISRQAAITKTIKLKSNGKQFRDFIPLSAVVASIEKAIELALPKEIYPVFNLGSGRSMSVLEIATLVSVHYETLFGKKIMIEKASPETNINEVDKLNFSVEKIKSESLFFEPDFNAEIDGLLLYCQKNYGVS